MDSIDITSSRLTDLYARLPRVGKSRPGIEVDLSDELRELYGQAHRHYHTLRHVEECLSEFTEVFADCNDPMAVEMALWYHDIVYEPTSSDNERMSANKATFDCARLGIENPIFVTTVVNLVLATKHALACTGDAAVVADIDLVILGSPWERFSEYEQQIRQEYAHVSEKDFVAGRSHILDGFMRRPRIYQTNMFLGRYEKKARGNIARSLMKLRSWRA